ncbi:hypothetical protein [Bacillus massiliigorillae]|uniref:hypothetical protein n=1 Tax=Bacillus massiliigorillae TaxID=1243664 RepID=UPI00039C3947|nr:hypothetical protein [Bacillus massiliigorillae]
MDDDLDTTIQYYNQAMWEQKESLQKLYEAYAQEIEERVMQIDKLKSFGFTIK